MKIIYTHHKDRTSWVYSQQGDMTGGEKMNLETVKNMLGWNSPIGVGIFFVCSGLTVYFLTLALQNIVNL